MRDHLPSVSPASLIRYGYKGRFDVYVSHFTVYDHSLCG